MLISSLLKLRNQDFLSAQFHAQYVTQYLVPSTSKLNKTIPATSVHFPSVPNCSRHPKHHHHACKINHSLANHFLHRRHLLSASARNALVFEPPTAPAACETNRRLPGQIGTAKRSANQSHEKPNGQLHR